MGLNYFYWNAEEQFILKAQCDCYAIEMPPVYNHFQWVGKN